ncbi:PLD nuclease N-terminal domain-containing protein [Sinomonas atrocyanea]|jgi:hypothetical protein|uniref:PLD nuclease N-terminal domain-containing protein n=1 Tax=Sinomonas atrocyanea TaxID=37927 RepID=UPI002781B041|nr:PLD nuclease N-terminal domain-containing protein [Sinomonas atrocyanea]MDQ0258980.1 hypothetical protein [Sinomonas atrocyanea]MDR6621913.1 hypothetical protein [Sinomonas atrocyanea]
MIRVLPWLIVLVAWLYGMVDCALSDRRAVRGGISKTLWFLISVLPAVGTILWFAFGRPRGTTPPRGRDGKGRRPMAPDDDPDFLRGL